MKHSSLGEVETLQVTASIASLFDDKWNCYTCMTSKYFERYKSVKGCVSDPRTRYQIEGYKLNKCLGNFVSREICAYYEMYTLYEKGIMPFEGVMTDQPAKLIDLFNMIGQLKFEYLDKERRKREGKKGNGKF